MKTLAVAILLLIISTGTYAQDSTGIDSSSAQVDTIPPRPKATFVSNVVFQFDNRNERYFDERGRMNGIKLGLEFYKRFRTGISFYNNNDFYKLMPPNASDTLSQTARFGYSTYFGELVIYRNFRWDLGVFGTLGSGRILVNNFDTKSALPAFIGQDTVNNVGIRDFGVSAQYKVFPWLGVGLGYGIRQVDVPDNKMLARAFTEPHLDFKMKLFLGYIYKGLFKKEKIQAEKDWYAYRKKMRHAKFKSILGK